LDGYSDEAKVTLRQWKVGGGCEAVLPNPQIRKACPSLQSGYTACSSAHMSLNKTELNRSTDPTARELAMATTFLP
jgi:hypothetical protein